MIRALRPPGFRAAVVGLCACAAALSACGARSAPSLPSGPGTAFPDAPAALVEATAQCSAVKTLSAELSLSGQAGGTKLRGRILGGFAAPGKVRLEAPAPFGRPVFVLVARDGKATLVLNRDKRVIRDASPAALVDALAGIPLDPDALRGVVAGCGFGLTSIAGGESFPGDWVSAEGDGTRVWLRRVQGTWRLVASSRGGVEVRYDGFAAARPAEVRLRRPDAASGSATDLTFQLSQVEINVPLEESVFDVDVPGDATPMTLDELRRSGPFGAAGAAAAAEPRSLAAPARGDAGAAAR